MCFQVNNHVSKLKMFPSYVSKLTIISWFDSPWSPVEEKDYIENISNLRWVIDFKRNQAQNLDLIENWLSAPSSGQFTDKAHRMARLLIDSNDPKWIHSPLEVWKWSFLNSKSVLSQINW